MFEADRSNVPRAYLPLSGDNEADLSIALTWLAGTGVATGQGIGVQIPSRDAVRENSTLRGTWIAAASPPSQPGGTAAQTRA